MHYRFVIVIFAVFYLMLAGCGGGGSSTNQTPTADPVWILNDTGSTTCANQDSILLACDEVGDGTGIGAGGGTSSYPSQDASLGRDNENNDDSDGRAGFSYTKLDSNGVALIDQSVSYGSTPWSCVLDNVSGLMWEIKTARRGGDLHDSYFIYTWYNSDANSNGGDAGLDTGLGYCLYNGVEGSDYCNTEKFVADVNAEEFCGYNGWRLPSRAEFTSLIDFGTVPNPAIELNYFPNTEITSFLTSSHALSKGVDYVFGVTHGDGTVLNRPKSLPGNVRLVRGG